MEKNERKPTVMVSLDTSTTATGHGVFENGELVCSGAIRPTESSPAEARIESMCRGVFALLDAYRPQIVVCEEQAFARSVSVAVANAKVIGATLGWSIAHGAEFATLRPSVWRRLVARDGEPAPVGRAEAKEWSKARFEELFGRAPADDNEADAALIGVARMAQFKDATP